MASKSVFQEYDTDALDYFDLAGDPIYGVLAGSKIEDVLVTQDETTYDNIVELISKPTETDQTFINKTKAFVLPGSPISNDKIKAALKEHKIRVTNDYTQADLIVTHSDFYDTFENAATIKTTKLMYRLWNYETTSGESNSNSYLNNIITSSNRHVIVTPKITDAIRYYALDIEDSLYDTWGLRRHRDGRWDWVKAPYKNSSEGPIPRYQHSALFIGPLMMVIGGRTNQVGEVVPLEV